MSEFPANSEILKYYWNGVVTFVTKFGYIVERLSINFASS